MIEQEQRAIEILDTFELRRKTKNYNKLDLNDVYASQIALNLISKLQEENKELREGKDTAENELKSQLEINEQLQADIDRLEKKNKRYEKYLKNKDKEHEKVLEFIETEKEKLQADIEIKDKVIDLMAEYMQIFNDDTGAFDKDFDNGTAKEIKQYFCKKVEE